MDNDEPQVFVDQDGEVVLVADGQVIKLTLPKNRGGRKPRAVVDTATGQTWPSLSDCARALGVSRQSVMSAVKRGYLCQGRQLAYAPVAKTEKLGQEVA